MRNRDMPAAPQGAQWGTGTPVPEGLTKLEFAAIAAMKGMLSDETRMEAIAEHTRSRAENCKVVAIEALEYANALFDELDSDGDDNLGEDAVVDINVGYGDIVTCTVCGGPPGSCSRNIDDCPHR